MRQIRILRDSSFRDGARNMALDCAILEAVARGEQPPTLRLYGWKPYCLSLGYGQRARDVDMAALCRRGWGLVRRPTGGKAILHGDELTYSLSLPIDHAMAGGDVVDSYRRISAGLLAALAILGVAATAERQSAKARRAHAGPVCFEMPSHYEISAGGRKLIGSAQLRRKGGLLQHGSLPLTGDLARICEVLHFESDAQREMQMDSVRGRALTLEQITDESPPWSTAAAAMERGFARAMNCEPMPGELSPAEELRADELFRGQFGNPDWTHKR
ncbi:MAG: biotin/lipoate A/B protein ligase family protein [Chloroflexi bacterium]|nr:biotin/lipoate A/B protein ligase family protein [Chloroflexota bacterium]